MDIAFAVGLGMLGVEDEHVIKLLGALGTVFEHSAHGGVAVDVGVFTLNVVFQRGLESQVLVNFHQAGVHLAHAGALVAVEDVFFCRAGMAAFDQDLFHDVLHLLDCGAGERFGFQLLFDLAGQLGGHLIIPAAGSLRGLENRVRDLVELEGDRAAVALDDLRYHVHCLLSPKEDGNRQKAADFDHFTKFRGYSLSSAQDMVLKNKLYLVL